MPFLKWPLKCTSAETIVNDEILITYQPEAYRNEGSERNEGGKNNSKAILRNDFIKINLNVKRIRFPIFLAVPLPFIIRSEFTRLERNIH